VCYNFSMDNYLGLFFAFLALVAWTIGDWNIQRATRTVGNWKSLFFIGFVGALGIFPFIGGELVSLFQNPRGLLLLTILAVITLVSALFLFEGLKRGKFAIIEPVFGLELPFTVAFSIIFAGEHLAPLVYFLIAFIFIGLLLTVSKSFEHLRFHKTVFEQGVFFAVIGSVGMGLMNFLTGFGSQTLSPLLTIWFVHTALAICCLAYLAISGEAKNLWRDLRANRNIILSESLFDNVAWISYATSMTLIPISIATAVSESYIALTVLIGVLVNKERLKAHQIFGACCVVFGVVILSFYTS